MKKVAVISDIHGNIEALNAVLEQIKTQKCDYILCGGDLVGYGPRPNEVISKIQELNIPTIMGNYDEAVGFLLPACGCHTSNPKAKQLSDHSLKWTIAHTSGENRAFLRELPEQLELEIEEKSILLIHATADSITEYVYEKDDDRLKDIAGSIKADIYIYGHTHFPYIKHLGNKTIINAGSVGRAKNGDIRATYILITIDGPKASCCIQKVAYNVDKVIKEIAEVGLDPYFGEFLQNGGEINNSCDLIECHTCL